MANLEGRVAVKPSYGYHHSTWDVSGPCGIRIMEESCKKNVKKEVKPMEAIASIVAVSAILLALVARVIENDREHQKRERMSLRTNEKPWRRSKR